MQWNSHCLDDIKMKNVLVILVVFLLAAGGCVQVGQQNKGSASAVVPTVVFEPSGSSYLLACVNELQGLKEKDLERYYSEAASRLSEGDDRDTLQFVCLSLHPKADYQQFQQGEKLFRKFIDEHPDASDDMLGLLALYSRLDQAMLNRETGQKKILAERDELAKEVETLKMQIKRDQGRIQELESQIDQLKNIENIIKNREH